MEAGICEISTNPDTVQASRCKGQCIGQV